VPLHDACAPVDDAAHTTSAARAQMVGSLGSVPVPSIEGMPPGTLLIRTVVTSICGSDLSGQPCADCDVGAWRGFTQEMPRGGFVDNQPGNEPFSVGPPVPGGSGHELMGEIAAYVEPCDVNVGDRVLAMSAGWAMAINRKEFETRTGVSSRVLLPVTSGGFLEYFVSTVDCIVPVPPPPRPSFNPLWYVAAQPFGTIIKAAAKLDSVLTKTVCIMGQGQNGLMMTSLIKSMGAKRVVVCDLFQNRLDIAEAMGATHTINCTGLDRAATVAAIREIVGGHPTRDPTGGADVCIDMAGHQGETLAILGDVAARSGKMLIFGLPPHEDSRFTGRNGIIGQGRTIGDGSFVGNTNSDMSISYAHLTKNLCVYRRRCRCDCCCGC
jgi:threonine dehydrogenase-like Zn-dependent dehydrogenase